MMAETANDTKKPISQKTNVLAKNEDINCHAQEPNNSAQKNETGTVQDVHQDAAGDSESSWKQKKKKKKKKPKQKPLVDGQTSDIPIQDNIVKQELRTQLSPNQVAVCVQQNIQVLQKPPQRHPQALFLCSLCQYFCDSWTVVETHIRMNRHISAMEDLADEKSIKLLPSPLEQQENVLTNLIEEITNKLGINKLQERKMILERIQKMVNEKFADCSMELYGSSVYLAGLIASDVNLNIDIPTSQNGPSIMVAVYEIIKEDETHNRNVDFDMYADIPTITFFDINTNLKCCLTLNNSSACEVAQLLLAYVSLDKRVLQIATAFRQWASLCFLDQVDNGMLPAHSFLILVIYYLQQLEVPVLPVLHELHDTKGEDPTKQEILDLDLAKKKWKCSNTVNVGELWLGLFKFYLTIFDVNEQIVCIKSQKPVKRLSKKWTGNRLAIEDPVVPHRNISKTLVNGKNFSYFMTCLRSTFLYFATPQMKDGPIFRRVQELPAGMTHLQHLLVEREAFLEYILKTHPCFQSDEELQWKRLNGYVLLNLADPNSYNIGRFIVTPDQAKLLFEKFNSKYLVYDFLKKDSFTGGKNKPLVCIVCYEEGHHKDKCPDDVLPQLEKIPKLSESYIKKLSDVCEAVYDSWALTPQYIEVRQKVVDDLLHYLRNIFPDVSLTLFGSSCNGFGLKGSDIDICLTFESNPLGQDLNFRELIQDLHHALRKYPAIDDLVPIATAKVPILKFSHYETMLDGDISFYNTLAQENTKLMWIYSAIDNRAKVLGYVVKYFTKICGICDASRGSLSSYAYILMVIHFLQQCSPPVLPVLQELERPDSTEEYIVEDCDTYFFKDLELLPSVWPDNGKNDKSIGELWIEFLCYYTEVFNFKRDVITIRRKKPMIRFEKLWNTKFMAIEDPFDVQHNLGAGLSRKMHNYIIKAFRKGRLHFSMAKNMSNSESLSISSIMELLFNHPKFKGAPPDRGCHYCKRIGHLCKDCPKRSQNRDDSLDQNECRTDQFAQSTNFTKQHNNVKKDITKANMNVGNTSGQHSLVHDDKGRRTKTWWNRSIPNFQPGMKPVSRPHQTLHTHHLLNPNVSGKIQVQLQELSKKWQAGPEYKDDRFHQQQHGRKVASRQSSQKYSKGVIDVYSQPSETEVSEISSVEFYNKKTHYPSNF